MHLLKEKGNDHIKAEVGKYPILFIKLLIKQRHLEQIVSECLQRLEFHKHSGQLQCSVTFTIRKFLDVQVAHPFVCAHCPVTVPLKALAFRYASANTIRHFIHIENALNLLFSRQHSLNSPYLSSYKRCSNPCSC